MSVISRYVRASLIASVAILCYFLAEIRTDGFRTFKVINKLQYDPSFEISTITDADIAEAKAILDLNFIYLGKGRQYFVFESVDGNYVLKLLNHNNFSYPSILKKLTFVKPIDKIVKRKDGKYPLTFSSMKLSYERLKEEAKLKFINLRNDIKLNKRVKITNKYGHTFNLDIDSTFFVLQKKVTPFFPSLEKIFEEKQEKGLENAIDYYLALVTYRCLKHVADDDLNVKDNIGFYKNVPVIIDTGRLYIDNHILDKYPLSDEMLRSTKFLRKWLIKNHPEQVSFLDQKLDYYIYRYSN